MALPALLADPGPRAGRGSAATQKPDARFVYNPVENLVLRRSAMTALARPNGGACARRGWRRAAQPPDGGLALQRLGASG